MARPQDGSDLVLQPQVGRWSRQETAGLDRWPPRDGRSRWGFPSGLGQDGGAAKAMPGRPGQNPAYRPARRPGGAVLPDATKQRTGDRSTEGGNDLDEPTWTVAILTVSDTGSRGERQDLSGPAVREVLTALPCAHVVAEAIVPDEADAVEQVLRGWVERGVALIVTTGGTGFSPRDVTPEATRRVIEREAPGLAEAMRASSWTLTPHAILSRAVTGIAEATLIVNLPGSPRAARENLEVILPALPHGLAKLQGDPSACGSPA